MWKAPALDGGDAFAHQLRAAVDQAGVFGAVGHGLAGDVVVVALVGLAEVGGVGAGDGALGAHPVHGGAGVQPAGEGDADAFADGEVLKDVGGQGVFRKTRDFRRVSPPRRSQCGASLRRGDPNAMARSSPSTPATPSACAGAATSIAPPTTCAAATARHILPHPAELFGEDWAAWDLGPPALAEPVTPAAQGGPLPAPAGPGPAGEAGPPRLRPDADDTPRVVGHAAGSRACSGTRAEELVASNRGRSRHPGPAADPRQRRTASAGG